MRSKKDTGSWKGRAYHSQHLADSSQLGSDAMRSGCQLVCEYESAGLARLFPSQREVRYLQGARQAQVGLKNPCVGPLRNRPLKLIGRLVTNLRAHVAFRIYSIVSGGFSFERVACWAGPTLCCCYDFSILGSHAACESQHGRARPSASDQCQLLLRGCSVTFKSRCTYRL